MLCTHGCGREAIKQTKFAKSWICESVSTKCPAIRAKNAKGTAKRHAEGRGNTEFGGAYNREWSRGKSIATDHRLCRLNSIDDYFTETKLTSNYTRKNILISERGYKCEKCQLPEWQGQPITLELDHIDGIKKNNTRDNLRLLCPNCHAQTPTWRKKKSAL